MQTSCYSGKAMQWGWQLHECQGLCRWIGLRCSRGPQRGDWWLYWYYSGELAWSHFQPWDPFQLGDLPGSYHWSGWVQHFLPSQELWGSPFWSWFKCTVCPGYVCDAKGLQTILFFLLGEGHSMKDLFVSKGEVPFHFLSQLQYAFHQ